MDKLKQQKGITLVALVITIIVLLILAGVTINLVLGDNGILNKAKTSGEEYTKASIKEEIELAIADIAAELASKNPTEGLTKQAIINNIADKVQDNIIIENDLTGEYKGYEYWIDEGYVVHIGSKANSSFKLYAKVEKIGTSYFIISAAAFSNQGEIVQYNYIIDGIENLSTDKTFTAENLEEKSEHTAKVIAIDDKGNKKESREFKIKTEEKTYLFKEGIENTQLTGGFEAIAKSYYNDGVGSTTTPTLNIDTSINASVTASSSTYWGGAIVTKNYLDITDYKYLYIRYSANLGVYNSASVVHYVYENENKNEILNIKPEVGSLCYTGPVSNRTVKINVESDARCKLGLYLQAGRQSGVSSFSVYEMWLEK